MSFIRPDIEALPPSGIAQVATRRLDDPDVIPLWFGEGDRVTPSFIRNAAKAALDDGETFYSFTRGTTAVREGIRDYLRQLYGEDIHPDRITMPGSSMLSVTIAAQMALSSGDHALAVSPHWPNIEMTMRVTGAEFSAVRQRLTETGWELTAAEIIDAVSIGQIKGVL